jgi:hypothetical protein
MVNKRFWRRYRKRRSKCLWIKRWISCEVFVRFGKTYAQKNSRLLVFVIAALRVLLHASLDTRKRRIAGLSGPLGGLRFVQGPCASEEHRETYGIRGRLPPAGGANRSMLSASGAGLSRAGRKRDGRPGVSRQDPPSGRSALFPAQGGGSGRQRLVLGANPVDGSSAERCAWACPWSDPGT